MQIAIDGPVAAGKGTVARLLARKLDWLYVDTGAFYRAAAYLGKRNGVDWNDEEGIAKLAIKMKFEMRNPLKDEKDGRLVTLLVDGEDLSWKIRTEDIGQGASIVSAHKKLRRIMVEKQREIAKNQNVIMEGRDITFRVLPDADLKIFMTADERIRARRRYRQLLDRGQDVEYEKVLAELKERDLRDSNRRFDPLQVVPDAWVVDTTQLTIEQVVDKIVKRVKRN